MLHPRSHNLCPTSTVASINFVWQAFNTTTCKKVEWLQVVDSRSWREALHMMPCHACWQTFNTSTSKKPWNQSASMQAHMPVVWSIWFFLQLCPCMHASFCSQAIFYSHCIGRSPAPLRFRARALAGFLCSKTW